MIGRRTALLALGLAGLALLGCSSRTSGGEITLAAAASLRRVLPDLSAAYEKAHPGAHVTATYGASGELEKQVEAGAPIDGVIFASKKPVDSLIEKGRADAATERVLASNQLVLIGPTGAKPVTFAALDALPAGEMLAIGDPGAVPAGQYARDYLQKLGKWEAVKGRLVLGADVSAVLAYAKRGEVAAAIVYRTEAMGISEVVILDEAKGPDAPRALVVGAVVRGAKAGGEAKAFLDFVASAEGQRLLAGAGFGPP